MTKQIWILLSDFLLLWQMYIVLRARVLSFSSSFVHFRSRYHFFICQERTQKMPFNMPFRIDPEKWKNNSKNSESILNSSCLMLVGHILLTGDSSRSKPLIDPVTLTFTPHKGPVYSVSSSPHHRNLFVSCSSDTTLRLHNVLQVSNHPDSTLYPRCNSVKKFMVSFAQPQQ